MVKVEGNRIIITQKFKKRDHIKTNEITSDEITLSFREMQFDSRQDKKIFEDFGEYSSNRKENEHVPKKIIEALVDKEQEGFNQSKFDDLFLSHPSVILLMGKIAKQIIEPYLGE